MPELPEVQNTVDGLRETVIGKTISDIWTDYTSEYYRGKQSYKDPEYFQWMRSQLIGKSILQIERRGKYITLLLKEDWMLLVHMKMTGHFMYGHWEWNNQKSRWQPPLGFWDSSWNLSREEVMRTMPFSDPYNNFIHLMITFEDGSQLALSDMRTFARFELLKKEEVNILLDSLLGIEPLEQSTTLKKFQSAIKRKPKKKIKSALLDQSLVTGFGNIYSDEALFSARIHPERLVESLNEDEWRALYQSGKKILRQAISSGGDSMGDYRRVDGTSGSYQGFHQVYQKEGSPCPHCGTLIEKKQIDQRMGRYCARCQL
ncbi:MAG: bifunctional DNA-formamidopyrimidine glycosylase/DNA-(apurinic or apyrimidinic site) lyase [Patescibacteria group bacterium]